MKYLIVFGGMAALLAILWVFYRPKPGQRRPKPFAFPRQEMKDTPEAVAKAAALMLRKQIEDFIAPDGQLPAAARDSRSIGYVLGWVEATFGAFGHAWDSATTKEAKETVFAALYGPDGQMLLDECARLFQEEDEGVAIGSHEGAVEAGQFARNPSRAASLWRSYLERGAA